MFVTSLLISLCAVLVTYYSFHLASLHALASSRPRVQRELQTHIPSSRTLFRGYLWHWPSHGRKLAAQTAGGAHIILLGRNQQAAENITSSLPEHNESLYEFERFDATSMKDVRRVTRSLLDRLEKANFIIASPGFVTLKGRDESEDGLDKKLSCHVYARFRFVLDLTPLLEKAAGAGETAAFMTVLGAGKEPTSYLNLDDLGLKREYSTRNAAAVGSHYTDAYIEGQGSSLVLISSHSLFF